MTTNRATATKIHMPLDDDYCIYRDGDGVQQWLNVPRSGFVDLPPRNIRQESPVVAKLRRPRGEAKREWGME